MTVKISREMGFAKHLAKELMRNGLGERAETLRMFDDRGRDPGEWMQPDLADFIERLLVSEGGLKVPDLREAGL